MRDCADANSPGVSPRGYRSRASLYALANSLSSASALGSLRPATRRSAEKGDEEPDKIELARLGLPHLFNSHRAVQVEHADQHSPEGTDAHHASGGLNQVMNSIILAVRVSVICHPYRLTNWLPVAWLTIRRELRIQRFARTARGARDKMPVHAVRYRNLTVA